MFCQVTLKLLLESSLLTSEPPKIIRTKEDGVPVSHQHLSGAKDLVVLHFLDELAGQLSRLDVQLGPFTPPLSDSHTQKDLVSVRPPPLEGAHTLGWNEEGN